MTRFARLLVVLVALPLSATASQKLSLDAYLGQVREGHVGLKASRQASEGALLRSTEGNLVTAPTVFGTFQLMEDKERNVFFPYQKLITNSYTVGVQQNYAFGLQARFSYNMSFFEYKGIAPGFHEGRPQLELTQSLWRNGFGSETRAQKRVIEAGALASHYSEGFRARAIQADSEATYWRLALARQNVEVQKDALDRARKLEEWSSRRVRLQLADRSDSLQAEAASELRRLQYTAALDEEKSASRLFNLNRGSAEGAVTEALDPLDPKMIDNLKVPERTGLRDDLQAAAKASEAADANAEMALNRDSPTVEAFGMAALNSRQSGLGDAFSKSFALSFPTSMIGVRFSAPIDLTATRDAREGYRREQGAAALNYQRRAFEVEQEWTDLVQKFNDSRRRLELARAIEGTQQQKLSHERERLNRGRTTTYQVLLFEQDYSQSQLSRIQIQAEVLQLIARMKLFGSNS